MNLVKRFLTWEGVLDFLEDMGLIKSQTQTLHDEVADDATAVEASRQQIVGIQTDITTKHDEVSDDATAVSTMLGMAQDIQIDVTDIQADITNKQTDITTKHNEVDADATAVETSRQQVQSWYLSVEGWFSTISGWYTQMEAWVGQVSANTTAAANSAATANSAASQAANIVFAGSTDFPTVPPVFSWHCDSGELDPRIDLSYTGNLSVTDQRGVLRSVPQGARALDYDPVTRACLGLPTWESRTNSIRNSTMQGAVAGAIGSGGALPTNWSISVSGLSAEIVSIGKENGRDYMDLKCSGISTGGQIILYIDGNAAVSGVTPGRSWTASTWMKLVSGSLSNLTSALLQIQERNSSSAYLAAGTFDFKSTLNDQLTRQVITRTLSDPATTKINSALLFGSTNGTAIDFTLRLAAPQLELGASASPYIPTSGMAASRGNINAVIQGPALQSIFKGLSEFTMVLEVDVRTDGLDQHLLTYLDNGNSFYAFRKNASGGVYVNIRQDGQLTGDISLAASHGTGICRYAGKFKPGDFRASFNGGTVRTSSSQNSFVPTRLQWGSQTGTPSGGQIVRQVIIYGPGITDAQLQALSRL